MPPPSPSFVSKLLNGGYSANQIGLLWLAGVLILGFSGKMLSGYHSLPLIFVISIMQLLWHYLFLIAVRRGESSPTSLIWTVIIAVVTAIATFYFLMALLANFQAVSH